MWEQSVDIVQMSWLVSVQYRSWSCLGSPARDLMIQGLQRISSGMDVCHVNEDTVAKLLSHGGTRYLISYACVRWAVGRSGIRTRWQCGTRHTVSPSMYVQRTKDRCRACIMYVPTSYLTLRATCHGTYVCML